MIDSTVDLSGYISSDIVTKYMNDIINDMRRYDSKIKVYIGAYDSDVSFSELGETLVDLNHPYTTRFDMFRSPTIVNWDNRHIVASTIEKDGCKYIKADDALGFLWTGYHETMHVRFRTREFVRIDASEQIKKIARSSLCANYFYEYKKYGYIRSPEEFFCEKYAFNHMKTLCESANFSFDWKDILLKHVNDSGFMQHEICNYDDLDVAFENRSDTIFDDSRLNGFVFNLSDCSRELMRFRDEDMHLFINAIYTKDGNEEADLLCRYIAKYNPEYFRLFQCIKDEYFDVVKPVSRIKEHLTGDFLLNIKGYTVDDFDVFELLRNSGYDEDKVNDLNMQDDLDISRTDPTDDW